METAAVMHPLWLIKRFEGGRHEIQQPNMMRFLPPLAGEGQGASASAVENPQQENTLARRALERVNLSRKQTGEVQPGLPPSYALTPTPIGQDTPVPPRPQ